MSTETTYRTTLNPTEVEVLPGTSPGWGEWRFPYCPILDAQDKLRDAQNSLREFLILQELEAYQPGTLSGHRARVTRCLKALQALQLKPDYIEECMIEIRAWIAANPHRV